MQRVRDGGWMARPERQRPALRGSPQRGGRRTAVRTAISKEPSRALREAAGIGLTSGVAPHLGFQGFLVSQPPDEILR